MSRSLSSVVLLSLLLACGGGAAESARPRSADPLTEEQATVFEDGVDFVADPTVLEGAWRESWTRELDLRVSDANAVALVTVHTLRTDVDLDRRTTFRLLFNVERTLLGSVDPDLTLRVVEGDAGFASLTGNEQRILNQPFVLFLRWAQAPGSEEVVARWHLSPAADGVVDRVEYLAERRRGVQREHQQRTVRSVN